MSTFSLGKLGEEISCRYLQNLGYKILDRNYSNKRGRKIGEIDIVALKGEELVFTEVKTRIVYSEKEVEEVLPENVVGPKKLRAWERISQVYVSQNDLFDKEIHFDVLTVLLARNGKCVRIKRLRDVFL